MEIKDYLHFYIGCEAEVVNKPDGLAITEDPQIHIIDGTVIECGDMMYSSMKPILRKLKSMTDEEALELAKIYSGAPNPKRIKGGRAVVSNMWYFECFDEFHLLIIGTTGEAWYEHYFDKRNEDGHRNIVCSHDATVYLLSKGFDLFDLIPNKLAIDLETIKQ